MTTTALPLSLPPTTSGPTTKPPTATDALPPAATEALPHVATEALPPASTDALPPAIVGSLSPSRASDFKTCPLLYRFRSIDKLPEKSSREAVRGTVVHSVLEGLYDLPLGERTVAAAQQSVAPAWQQLLADQPELAQLFDAPGDDSVNDDAANADAAGEDSARDAANAAALADWLDSARRLVANYFELEDPNRLEPAAREEYVEVVLDGLRLRGYIDRLDISPAGDIRIVDYKTGSIPREAFEAKALFQMKFYALVLWRTRGVVPRQLRLMYLADTDTLSYSPEAEELARFEKTLHAIWDAIAQASLTGDFRPNPSRLCDWCSHHAFCPAKGGTPPPFPRDALATATAAGNQRPINPSRAVEPTV